MPPTPLSTAQFNRSTHPITEHKQHRINWFVHRNTAIRNQMQAMWNNGAHILNKRTMEGANDQQLQCRILNILFRSMENFGPNRNEFGHFRYDRKNDAFHCHVWEKGVTFVVIWEADEEKKLINILDMGTHENFKFKRIGKKKDSIARAETARAQDVIFRAYPENLKLRLT